jgi:hypothetical protein
VNCLSTGNQCRAVICCAATWNSYQGKLLTCVSHNRGGHVFTKILKLKKKWIKAIKRNMDRNKYQLWNPTKTSVEK